MQKMSAGGGFWVEQDQKLCFGGMCDNGPMGENQSQA